MSTIRIKCPECGEIMEVNTRTGKVGKHHPAMKPGTGGDFLKDRLKSLDGEKAAREAIVAESREKERTRKDAHKQLFAKVKKQAEEGPDRNRRDTERHADVSIGLA